jgi:hypothetical protein
MTAPIFGALCFWRILSCFLELVGDYLGQRVGRVDHVLNVFVRRLLGRNAKQLPALIRR